MIASGFSKPAPILPNQDNLIIYMKYINSRFYRSKKGSTPFGIIVKNTEFDKIPSIKHRGVDELFTIVHSVDSY